MNESIEAEGEAVTAPVVPRTARLSNQSRPPEEEDVIPETQSEIQKEISITKERMKNPSMIPILKGPGKIVGFKVTGSTKKKQIVRQNNGEGSSQVGVAK